MQNYDYIIEYIVIKRDIGGSTREDTYISSNCFKELCMLSRTGKAKEVRKYFISMEKLVKRYHEMIKEKMYKKIGLLMKNQRPVPNIRGGVIYIMEALNSDVTLYKLGRTDNLRNRFHTYNTGNANDVEPLFILKVNDIDTVEGCVKNFVRDHQYRKYREIYEIDINILKQIMVTCNDFVNSMKKYITTKEGIKKMNRIKKTKNKLFMGVYHVDN